MSNPPPPDPSTTPDPSTPDPSGQDPNRGRAEPPPAYGSAPPPPPAYGNAPAYPAAPQYGQGTPPPVPADPPPSLALAVRLMYLGAVLSILDIVLLLTQRDALRSQLAKAGTSASALDAAVTVAVVSTIVVGLIGTGLWVLNAVFNARGAKWARVLSTVLGVLAVVTTLLSFTQPDTALNRALSVAQLLVAAAVVLLLWRPDASLYYEARSQVRTV
jgi:hypothetical protein